MTRILFAIATLSIAGSAAAFPVFPPPFPHPSFPPPIVVPPHVDPPGGRNGQHTPSCRKC